MANLNFHIITIASAASFAAGAIDAIAGGGGLITVPTLLSLGLPPHLALGTNKAQSAFGTAAAARTYLRGGHITADWINVLFYCAIAGGAIGTLLVMQIDPKPLRVIVLVLLVSAAMFMLIRPYLRLSAKTLENPKKRVGLFSFLIGAYDGFFGPGTGSFMIIALSTWAGNSLIRASANTKIMNLASNLASFAVFVLGGHVLWKLALPMALSNIAGQLVGVRLAVRGGDKFIRVVILVVVVALVIKVGADVF